MTEIVVYRSFPSKVSTIGELYIDNTFCCNTLEDVVRSGDDLILEAGEKVYGKTAIPTGRYQVTLGDFHGRGKLYPMLMKVPLFSGIYFHGGNTAEDTLGCLLIGHYDPKFPDVLFGSRGIFLGIFLPKVVDALSKGDVYCTITGGRHVQNNEEV